MTLTTHTATGVLAAYWTGNPLLGFACAIILHYIFDAIPHGDEFLYWRHQHKPGDLFAVGIAAADLFGVILLILFLMHFSTISDPFFIIAGVVGGILPDALMMLHTRVGRRRKKPERGLFRWVEYAWLTFVYYHYEFHERVHDLIRTPIRFRYGIAAQLLYLTIFVIYMMKKT